MNNFYTNFNGNNNNQRLGQQSYFNGNMSLNLMQLQQLVPPPPQPPPPPPPPPPPTAPQSHPQPLMQTITQTHAKPAESRINLKCKIYRYDRDDAESLMEKLTNSLITELKGKKILTKTNFPQQQQQQQNKEKLNCEISTTDFNHGLSAAVSSCVNFAVSNEKTISMCVNDLRASKLAAGRKIVSQQIAQTLPPPTPLLSLKVNQASNDSKKSTIFPILNENCNKETSSSQNDGRFRTGLSNNTTIPIEQLIQKPYRDKRPHKILIIMRGLPGSGKSFLTNLIKAEEEKHVSSSEKPKILSIDNYFLNEHEQIITNLNQANKKQIVMKYEYDKDMDEAYQRSLLKSLKKTIDDALFNFLIVDMINDKVSRIDEMNNYAKMKGFYVYVAETENDPVCCFKRNEHGRTMNEIQQLVENWEVLPSHYTKLDVSSLIHSQEIENVEMDEGINEITEIKKEEVSINNASNETTLTEADKDQENVEARFTVKSKWDSVSEERLNQLDGVNSNKKMRKDNANLLNIEDYIQLESDNNTTNSNSLKKRVKWLDQEETKKLMKQKEIGFVIGQSVEERQKLAENYVPSLEQVKYI